jgi:hypothetical protein
MKIYLVRKTEYADFGNMHGGRLKSKNKVARCCATKELAEQFVRDYAPFPNVDPEMLVVEDVPEGAFYSRRAVREIRCVDEWGFGERVSLWIDERDLLGAEVEDEAEQVTEAPADND